ncbi:MAG: hypothetical protein NZT61_02750 [Deltaproteobacteria bacterium]|nr:hypothetical protein [Deltaproteobacteria bacterium]
MSRYFDLAEAQRVRDGDTPHFFSLESKLRDLGSKIAELQHLVNSCRVTDFFHYARMDRSTPLSSPWLFRVPSSFELSAMTALSVSGVFVCAGFIALSLIPSVLGLPLAATLWARGVYSILHFKKIVGRELFLEWLSHTVVRKIKANDLSGDTQYLVSLPDFLFPRNIQIFPSGVDWYLSRAFTPKQRRRLVEAYETSYAQYRTTLRAVKKQPKTTKTTIEKCVDDLVSCLRQIERDVASQFSTIRPAWLIESMERGLTSFFVELTMGIPYERAKLQGRLDILASDLGGKSVSTDELSEGKLQDRVSKLMEKLKDDQKVLSVCHSLLKWSEDTVQSDPENAIVYALSAKYLLVMGLDNPLKSKIKSLLEHELIEHICRVTTIKPAELQSMQSTFGKLVEDLATKVHETIETAIRDIKFLEAHQDGSFTLDSQTDDKKLNVRG